MDRGLTDQGGDLNCSLYYPGASGMVMGFVRKPKGLDRSCSCLSVNKAVSSRSAMLSSTSACVLHILSAGLSVLFLEWKSQYFRNKNSPHNLKNVFSQSSGACPAFLTCTNHIGIVRKLHMEVTNCISELNNIRLTPIETPGNTELL